MVLLALAAVLGLVYTVLHTAAPTGEPVASARPDTLRRANVLLPPDTLTMPDTLVMPELAALPSEELAPLPGTPPDPPAGVVPELDAPAAARTEEPVPVHVAPPPDALNPSTANRASFSLRVRDLVSPYRILGLFVVPGEEVDLEALFTRPAGTYRLLASGGETSQTGRGQWKWTAPMEPGLYTLTLGGPDDTVQLNLFVMTPFDHATPDLQGYRIGAYEREPLRGNPRFGPPPGFFEVTANNASARVSPHFNVGMFTSKQSSDFPKYVVLDERLLLKLEMLLEEAERHGIPAASFVIMSGFRTPYYNKSIGNTTVYSQHLFGRAADIYIDKDGNGSMDDLNGDGAVDLDDARTLYKLVDDLQDDPWYEPFIGGLGLYGPKPHRGPFIHVDVRGYLARW